MQDKDSLPVLVPKEVSKRLFTPWVRLLLVVFGLIFLGVTLYATDVTSWVRTSPVRSPDGEELVETATDDVGIYKEKTTDVALTKKTTFSKKVKNQGHVGDHHLPKQRKPKLSISDFPNQSSKDREPVSTTTTSYVSENGPTEDHTPLSEVDVLTNISAEDAATPEEIISIDQLLFTERITEMEIFLRQVRASKKKPDESRSFLNRHKKHRIVPLPKTMHLTLSDEDIGDRDVFLIGDVHGCLDELLKLLEKANVTQKNSLIIFLGDVVNKGPRNLDTLAFVRGLVAEGAALSVRGNHEENVVFQWMRYKKAKARGTVYRPKKRYRYNWTQVLKKSDIKYMEQLPITISIPSVNAILVHAGMVPEIPLDAQYPANLVTIRNMLKGTDNYGMPRATSKRTIGIGWAHLWHGPQHVYFGHDALRGLQLHEYATGIDTACVMGKQLTGLFVKGPRASEMVQVQSNFAF